MDGKTQCAPGDSCPEWAVKFMADYDKSTIVEWQARNLAELDL
jgi:hypothetical protein